MILIRKKHHLSSLVLHHGHVLEWRLAQVQLAEQHKTAVGLTPGAFLTDRVAIASKKLERARHAFQVEMLT